jgi:GNAT superfamily N-acetyltransferase
LEPQTRIREAALSDSNSIADLMGELGYPTASDQMRIRLEATQKDHSYRTFVAEVEGEVVGVIGVRLGVQYQATGSYAQIIAFVTKPAFRGKGVGKSLLKSVENWAKKQKVSRVVVTCRVDRTRAHRFYELNNYEKTGFRFAKVFE